MYAGEESSLEDEEKEERGAKRGGAVERVKRNRVRQKEKERNADGIISNAPQHVAPVGPPPGCQTCFFLCAIVWKAKVQRERGCRINVVPVDRF